MKKQGVTHALICTLALALSLAACGQPDRVLEPAAKSTSIHTAPSTTAETSTAQAKTTCLDKEIQRGSCYLGIRQNSGETLVHVAYYDQFEDERYRKNYGTVRFEDEGKVAEVALVMKAEGSAELIEGPLLCVRVDFVASEVSDKHNRDYTDRQGKTYTLELEDEEIIRVISHLRDEVAKALQKG